MTYKSDAYECMCILYQRYLQLLSDCEMENQVIKQRLHNFWLESIYCCYIIELNAPSRKDTLKENIKKICSDGDFCSYSRKLSLRNCTLKGLVFVTIVKLRMHWLMRLVYVTKTKLRIK